MSRLIATFLGVGLMPLAPGTWGSAAAIPVAWVIHALGGFPALAAATLIAFTAGLWATVRQMRGHFDKDPQEIVIDEVVGMWITLWPLSAGLWHAGMDPWLFPWPGWIGGFVMFRLFDIWKPWLVARADRRGDALGVMLDDVLAGLFAALVVAAAAFVAHGLLGA
ncbi:phosphatidylglycerophosphatase A [Meinhardsimonia xiamenensis]|jgi:phosphatidylglycerophosphatase A|uniref:Phosphatidylglycerophosphatase A n=1 Tax=Meinhardsimonia xiamenensis TaxID=990712 RepID=A0A1G9FJZ8_9RHOB|nr:phosphatidylglycerophosphatase A [Meinhardsimonia xiamenensis]PRX37809.1 phosphatidylglycerophosphatase A [Meinhardsimonia xiamenensis]SDK88677.1 phosphatidylglycerophosphatase A [Meinhardsimonia xiamenensis]